MVQPSAAAQAKAAAQKAAQEAEEKKIAEERHRRATDTNYNPLLLNGITNKDVSLTYPQVVLAHFLLLW